MNIFESTEDILNCFSPNTLCDRSVRYQFAVNRIREACDPQYIRIKREKKGHFYKKEEIINR